MHFLSMPILAVFITAAIFLNEVCCRPAQEIDVDTILEILQTQNDLNERHEDWSGSSSSSSDSSKEDNSYSLRNKELSKLFQEISKRDRRYDRLDRLDDDTYRYKYKNNRDVPNQYDEYLLEERDQERNTYKERNDKKTLEQVLEELVTQNLLNKKSTANRSQLNKLPSTLLDSVYRDKKDAYNGNLNKYSKLLIFLIHILNPRTLETSKNKMELSELISRMVYGSALNEDRDLLKKGPKYRGFPGKSNLFSRRFRSNSKESN